MKKLLNRFKKSTAKTTEPEFWLEDETDRLRRAFRRPLKDVNGLEINHQPDGQKSFKKIIKKPKIPEKVTIKVPRLTIPRQITIKLPKKQSLINIFQNVKKLLLKKPKISLLIFMSIFIICLFLAIIIFQPNKSDPKAGDSPKTVVKPDFNPATTLGKKAKGDSNIKYSPDKKSASLEDDFFGKKIIISQQQLKQSPSEAQITLEKAASSIAQTFNLSITNRQSISTENGIFYFYDIPDSDQQRGVTVYRDLLIFFIADKKLDASDWKEYLKTLVLVN